MSKSDSTLIAIGGGEFSETADILQEFLGLLKGRRDPQITVMTVATNEPEKAASKYNSMFRSKGIRHVSVIDISEREDAFQESALKRVREADALFFTGGDQLNVTSLLGGSPLHDLIHERITDEFIIAGTSAGAAMMSNSMVVSGRNDTPPQVGGVEIAPGMDLLSGTIIDTHFTQRGRHGRLMTAIAHYPQDLGIGVDERTAVVVRGSEFKVLGEGVVTIFDGSKMKHSNLPYRHDKEPLGLFDVCVHVLPAGYKYNLKKREPISPPLKHLASAAGNEE
ncbi:MAG TPA: cyanophycinase [Pyrinomonadaceae bacterium]|nr:cyanophycinase [Pyrinomonadaceae bacterium]